MKIITVNSKKYGVKEILVDDEDFEYVNQWRWGITKDKNTFYAKRTVRDLPKRTSTSVHRAILKPEIGEIIDHKDGNGLNCQKNNLRKVTNRQNLMNQKKRINCSSKYIGVSYRVFKRTRVPDSCLWYSNISVNGKRLSLGYFHTELEAAHAYNVACAKYFREFGNPNRDENGQII